MRVTLMESSPSLRLALRRWLHSRGHEVTAPLEGGGPDLDCDVLLLGSSIAGDLSLAEVQRSAVHVVEVPLLDPAEGTKTIDFPVLERMLDGLAPRRRGLALRIDLGADPLEPGLVAQSEPMRELMVRVQRLARVDIPVLIQGETGTGKELVARALHELGPRAPEPFVAVHCGAIPEELLESILFGHERGSFTDAVRRHCGHLENAGKGTVLLDEIAEMPLRLQAKLLRVLQQRCFHRVGGTEEIQLRARVLAATHRDLKTASATGDFRADLLHRIAGAVLVVPPLRQRRADIPSLVQQFLDGAARSLRVPVQGLTHRALDLLSAHPWPGNVRQLQNVLHRALVLGDAVVLDEPGILPHLDEAAPAVDPGEGLDAALAAFVSERRRLGHPDRLIAEELRDRLETALTAPHPAESEFGSPPPTREREATSE